MAIDITMPALSPTMEAGKLARWHVKEGDSVRPGDVLAEIETDKATMEFEAVDEGTISAILVPEGTENVKVNAVIARLAEAGEDATAAAAAPAAAPAPPPAPEPAPAQTPAPAPAPAPRSAAAAASGPRTIASPLARRIAAKAGLDLAGLSGSGPHGRIVKADVEARLQAAPHKAPAAQPEPAPEAAAPAKAAPAAQPSEVPHEDQKLSSMRRVIARRLTESKQTVPHYYLTIDVCLDPLLALRTELNATLESRGLKLSVNDLLIKALAAALTAVPDANVSFTGDAIRHYRRADISVAVAIPGGLITPVVRDAAAKSISAVAAEMKALSARAREGKLQPPDYTGGTASLSNLGMYGIRQFEAVINPPEGMILAVGAGQRRPWVADDRLTVATVLSATGSFDHRAIDGAVGAELMQAFQNAVEHPLALIA